MYLKGLLLLVMVSMLGGCSSSKKAAPAVESPAAEAPAVTASSLSADTDTASEAAYQAFIIKQSQALATSLDGLSTQSVMAGENPMLILDEDWTTKTAVYVLEINTTSQAIIDYDTSLVPAAYKDVHTNIVLGSKDFITAMDYFVDGIDNIDADKITKASEYMTSGSGYITKATELINGLIK